MPQMQEDDNNILDYILKQNVNNRASNIYKDMMKSQYGLDLDKPTKGRKIYSTIFEILGAMAGKPLAQQTAYNRALKEYQVESPQIINASKYEDLAQAKQASEQRLWAELERKKKADEETARKTDVLERLKNEENKINLLRAQGRLDVDKADAELKRAQAKQLAVFKSNPQIINKLWELQSAGDIEGADKLLNSIMEFNAVQSIGKGAGGGHTSTSTSFGEQVKVGPDPENPGQSIVSRIPVQRTTINQRGGNNPVSNMMRMQLLDRLGYNQDGTRKPDKLVQEQQEAVPVQTDKAKIQGSTRLPSNKDVQRAIQKSQTQVQAEKPQVNFDLSENTITRLKQKGKVPQEFRPSINPEVKQEFQDYLPTGKEKFEGYAQRGIEKLPFPSDQAAYKAYLIKRDLISISTDFARTVSQMYRDGQLDKVSGLVQGSDTRYNLMRKVGKDSPLYDISTFFFNPIQDNEFVLRYMHSEEFRKMINEASGLAYSQKEIDITRSMIPNANDSAEQKVRGAIQLSVLLRYYDYIKRLPSNQANSIQKTFDVVDYGAKLANKILKGGKLDPNELVPENFISNNQFRLDDKQDNKQKKRKTASEILSNIEKY